MKREHKHVSIDYYAYISGLRHWNADFKVAFAAAAVLLVVALDSSAVSVATLLFMLILTVGKGKIALHDYLHLLTVPMFFIIFSGIAIMIQFGTPRGSIFCIPLFATHLYVTEKSLMLAVTTGMKAFGAVSALYMMSLSTPMGEILSVFRRIHLPDIIVELMHLIYRYIFILSEINQKQKDAARSRLGYRNYRTSLHTFGSELANLFVMSMKKSGSYYDAMESRGYTGRCLFWEEKKRFTRGQAFCAGIYAVTVAAAFLMQKVLFH